MLRLSLSKPPADVFDELAGPARARLADLSPAWPRVLELFYQFEEELFATEGASGADGAWSDYGAEPKYRAFKEKILGSSRPILVWSGELRDQMTSALETSATPRSLNITAGGLAASMSSGGVGPFGEPYPARPVVSLTADQHRQLFDVVRRFVLFGDVP